MKMRAFFFLFAGCWLLLAASASRAQNIELDPKDGLDFRCVPVGDTAWLYVRVTNREDRPVPFSYELPPGPGGNAQPFIIPQFPGGRFNLPPRASRTDSIGFAPRTVNPGGWDTDLNLRAGGGGRREHIDLRGFSSPPRQPVLTPPSLTSVIPPGDTALLCATIANPSCGDLLITQITLPDPAIFRLVSPPPPYLLAPRGEQEICIEFTPAAGTPANDTVRVETRGGRVIELPMEWKRPAYLIKVIPRGLIFDSTLVTTQSAEDTLAFVNIGAAPVTLTDWRLYERNPDEFLVVPPAVPVILRPDGADTVIFRVRFAPKAAGQRTAGIRVEFGGDMDHPMLIPIRGVGTTGGVLVSPQEIDLGRVVIGDSVTESGRLEIRNTSGAPVQVVEIRLGGDDPGMFEVIGARPASILPGESATYDLKFRPDATRLFMADAIVKLQTGPEVTVRLLGRGTDREYRFSIRLDSATADVNDRFPIHLFIDPPLTGAENITSFTATLRLDPLALYPHRVIGTNTQGATISYPSSDTIVIERTSGAVITGAELFALELEGLVTGRRSNLVELIDLELGTNVHTTIAGNSVVVLNGCAVEVAFGRPVMVHAIYPTPASGTATVRYTAPSGSRPAIRVIDITGRVVAGDPLPEGTGAEQKATVDVGGLGPGVYFLEMRVGTGLARAPIVVRE